MIMIDERETNRPAQIAPGQAHFDRSAEGAATELVAATQPAAPASPVKICSPLKRAPILTLSLLAVALMTSSGARALPAQTADVVAIKEGADLDLSCPIVVQNEDMIISWTCDSEPANIKSSRIQVTESGKLRIKSAKVGDSCNYRCEAADGYGTLSVIIKVIIVDKRLMEQLGRQNETFAAAAGAPPKLGSSSRKHLVKQLSESKQQQPQARPLLMEAVPLESSFAPSAQAPTRAPADNQSLAGDQPAAPTNQGSAEEAELEIQVRPERVHVDKNRTFTLECKVKHASHLRVPQIIWLKEFIGKRPDSLSEAHEQNLVLIDNVYYHSLNWPRSITYSKRTACANSALLIRHSSFVHSGRYICFAGYPPTIMATNLTLGQASQLEGKQSNGTEPAAGRARANQGPASVEYKMALAVVHVEDELGARNQALEAKAAANSEQLTSSLQQTIALSDDVDGQQTATSGQDQQQQPSSGNLLINILANNTWTRNLTLLLMLCCGLLYAAKLVHLYKPAQSKKRAAAREDSGPGCAKASLGKPQVASTEAEAEATRPKQRMLAKIMRMTSGPTRKNNFPTKRPRSMTQANINNNKFASSSSGDALGKTGNASKTSPPSEQTIQTEDAKQLTIKQLQEINFELPDRRRPKRVAGSNQAGAGLDKTSAYDKHISCFTRAHFNNRSEEARDETKSHDQVVIESPETGARFWVTSDGANGVLDGLGPFGDHETDEDDSNDCDWFADHLYSEIGERPVVEAEVAAAVAGSGEEYADYKVPQRVE